ncbi:MAG: glycerate kinase [Eubacteriales bacterium]|nr:glycerate kinase [Eubacteriales bacterium]
MITGEGKIGGQSLRGKIVIGVAWRVRAAGDSAFGNEKAKRTGLPFSRSELFLPSAHNERIPSKKADAIRNA